MLLPFVEQLCNASLVGRFVRVLGLRIARLSHGDSKGSGAGCRRPNKPTSIDAHEQLPQKAFDIFEFTKWILQKGKNIAMLSGAINHTFVSGKIHQKIRIAFTDALEPLSSIQSVTLEWTRVPLRIPNYSIIGSPIPSKARVEPCKPTHLLRKINSATHLDKQLNQHLVQRGSAPL
jgi:hypothetical protein